MVVDWHLYAMIVISVAAFWLQQAALQTGALSAAVASSMAFDPLSSIPLDSGSKAMVEATAADSAPEPKRAACWSQKAGHAHGDQRVEVPVSTPPPGCPRPRNGTWWPWAVAAAKTEEDAGRRAQQNRRATPGCARGRGGRGRGRYPRRHRRPPARRSIEASSLPSLVLLTTRRAASPPATHECAHPLDPADATLRDHARDGKRKHDGGHEQRLHDDHAPDGERHGLGGEAESLGGEAEATPAPARGERGTPRPRRPRTSVTPPSPAARARARRRTRRRGRARCPRRESTSRLRGARQAQAANRARVAEVGSAGGSRMPAWRCDFGSPCSEACSTVSRSRLSSLGRGPVVEPFGERLRM